MALNCFIFEMNSICFLFLLFRFIQMSSRTAAANSFSLTNYKIPLLCNACKLMYYQIVKQSSKASFFIFLSGDGITSSNSVELLFNQILT